jgi:adenosine deaminase
VIYTEAFLSPNFCGGGDLGAWRDYLAAIKEAADEAERDSGIIMRGVVTCIRHEGPDAAKPDALCAAETMGDFITGFGMGGAENVGHQGDYAYAFDLAREAGLRLTTHAGEWGGAASVWEAVRDLKVKRIGHGVQCVEDPALVDYLAENEIVLEVCPGSNVALGVVPNWAAHPIERLREAGVKVTVSTDDPPFFHTSLTREYDMLAETFGWDGEVVREVNLTAADAAFCDAPTREKLRKKLEPNDV